ncbi:MAG: flagellar hook-length control protein FliK [Anaerolineae bacterium]|nr:flagellar hook-length control protein FliK [Anaerolineae bacterium]
MNTLPIVLPADPLAGCLPFAGTAPPGEDAALFAGTLAEALAHLSAQATGSDSEAALTALLAGDWLPAAPVATGAAETAPESEVALPSPEGSADNTSLDNKEVPGEGPLNWAGLAALLALAQQASPATLPAAAAARPAWMGNSEVMGQQTDSIAAVTATAGEPLSGIAQAGEDGVRLVPAVRGEPVSPPLAQAAHVARPLVPAVPAEGVPLEGMTSEAGDGVQMVAPEPVVRVVGSPHSSKPTDGAGGSRESIAPVTGHQGKVSSLQSETGQIPPEVEPNRSEASIPAGRLVPEPQPSGISERRDVMGQTGAARNPLPPQGFTVDEGVGETRNPLQPANGQADVVTQGFTEAAMLTPAGAGPERAQVWRQADVWMRFSEPHGVSQRGAAQAREPSQGTVPMEPGNFWQPGLMSEATGWPFRGTRERLGVKAQASGKAVHGSLRAVSPEYTETRPLVAAEKAVPQGSPLRYETAQEPSPERQGGQPQRSAGYGMATTVSATSAASAASTALQPATPMIKEGPASESVEAQSAVDKSSLHAFSWANEKDGVPAAVSRYLVERLTQAVRRGEQQCRLALYPKELGRVDAQLSFSEERLSVYLRVETAQAHRVVQQALPELRFALEGRGLLIGQCDVGLMGGGTTSGQWFDQPHDRAGVHYVAPHHRDGSGDIPLAQARVTAPARPRGLVDLMI